MQSDYEEAADLLKRALQNEKDIRNLYNSMLVRATNSSHTAMINQEQAQIIAIVEWFTMLSEIALQACGRNIL